VPAGAGACGSAIIRCVRARAMPYVGRSVAVVYLGEVVGGVIRDVDDGGRRLGVVTAEGERLWFELDRATAMFVVRDGRGGPWLRFL
jgi:hypothetical protein